MQRCRQENMTKERTGSNKNSMAPLGELFSGVYAEKQWKNQWRLYHLAREWPTIVGPEVARLTMPAFFRQETLWIYVQDSAWMHHLQFIKLDLLVRVNQALEEQPIVDLRWQLQPHLPPQPERRLPDPQPVDAGQEQSFRQMTDGIANQDCREALQRLWRIFAAYPR